MKRMWGRKPGGRAGTAAVLCAAVLGLTAAGGGTAHADEYHRDSHNAPRVSLVHIGQVDDPMEDVLEHTLLFGGGHTWD